MRQQRNTVYVLKFPAGIVLLWKMVSFVLIYAGFVKTGSLFHEK